MMVTLVALSVEKMVEQRVVSMGDSKAVLMAELLAVSKVDLTAVPMAELHHITKVQLISLRILSFKRLAEEL
jgi:hypothetical protein